jgi:tripartite-type tricarboxylate transporter receptor subunit TctC
MQRLAFIFLTCLCCTGAQAADSMTGFSSRPIRIVVGFTPGGQPEIIMRAIAVRLTESFGQQIIFDNRPGAGGTIGAKIVAEATSDGHTLLSTSASYSITPSMYAKLPYDPIKDLAGITTTATAPYVLVVPAALGVKSVRELLALAKAKPGALNFGSAGTGSATHFAAEIFKSAAQIDVVHVPYKGVPEALTDTVAGRVQFFMTPASTLGSFVKDGRLRALASSGTRRSSSYPDAPTIAESGVPGYVWETWAGILAPAKTPRPIIDNLNRALTAALGLPDVQQRIAALGADPAPKTPAEFDKLIASEIARVGELARKAGIKPQ